MAGAVASGQGIPVMFVRHGQSTNNPVYEGLFKQMDDGLLTREEVEATWMRQRLTDPPLTELGKHESVCTTGRSLAHNPECVHAYTSSYINCARSLHANG
eukprot:m.68261 g.68261  ORF g.68261 m.68261 type:complete len:100 (+) comp8501_c0_seq2:115-414(+)